MSNFTEELRLKKKDCYANLNKLWFGEQKNVYFDGLSDLLDCVYFEDSLLVSAAKSPKIFDTISTMLRLKTQTDYKIRELYDLVSNDMLYTVLTYAKISYGYFIMSVYLYIWGHAGFNLDEFYSLTCYWTKDPDADDNQALFNAVSKQIMARLGIFYK